jgi:Tol biopolymer transport system component
MRRLATAVLPLILAACADAASPVDPPGGPGFGKAGGAPPPNPAVAYYLEGARDRLMVMNADGTNAFALGTFDDIMGGPSWSPDRTHIAFGGIVGGVRGLYVVDVTVGAASVTASAPRLVTPGSTGLSASWSPRDSRIAYTQCTTPGGQWDCSILTVPAEGGTPTVVYHTGPTTRLAWVIWSPDATRLAVVTDDRSVVGVYTYGIDLVDVQAGTATTLIPFGPVQPRFPDWSNDGTRIAYSAQPFTSAESQEKLTVVDAATGATTTFPVQALGASWAPDDSALLFTNQTATQGVSRYALSTGQVTALSKQGRNADWYVPAAP